MPDTKILTVPMEGSMRKWFGGNIARYQGLAKTHTQLVLLAIAHNLKRSPGLLVPNALK